MCEDFCTGPVCGPNSKQSPITIRKPAEVTRSSISGGVLGFSNIRRTGFDRMTTISYTFKNPRQSVTLFGWNSPIELPKGVGIPDRLLTVCCRPDGIDRYHAAIEKELDKEFGQGDKK